MEPHLANDAFALIQSSWLGDLARRSTWLYPASNILHVVGAALLAGSIAVLDVALLRRMKAAGAIARVAIPLAASGLALQVVTGSILFSAEASALVRNPAFLFKMALIVLGLANIIWFHLRFRGVLGLQSALPTSTAWHGGVSLAVWIFALMSGRAIAYL